MADFDYGTAFSRNIGWLTEAEQNKLRASRIAIAGLGGVGGSHLLTLSRLGIGKFSIADFDRFELQNFNRQAGAVMSSVGQQKSEVLTRMARDVNPELDVRVFAGGVTPDNLDAFLDGVDAYVDSIDFFAVDARRRLFQACYEKNIPAFTAAPLGMGVAFLYFQPGAMSFEEYFRMEGCSKEEQLVRFMAGLSPAALHSGYLRVPSSIDFKKEKGPSTAMACEMCAGVMGVEVLKVLLERSGVACAPRGFQFDAYKGKLVKTWRPFGNANPLQRLLMMLIRKMTGLA